ncbi:MAG: hypothetical protein L0Y56_06955, partial [Nitrospira sp.]|nr:hypothetical protein [Nitrospira sp.]
HALPLSQQLRRGCGGQDIQKRVILAYIFLTTKAQRKKLKSKGKRQRAKVKNIFAFCLLPFAFLPWCLKVFVAKCL